MKPRNLKIETVGDYWRGRVTPKIRLAGYWLERAGFKPGNRVEIEISSPGVMTLRFLKQSTTDTPLTQIAPSISHDTHVTLDKQTTHPDTDILSDYNPLKQQTACFH